jgi:hypothetical protein
MLSVMAVLLAVVCVSAAPADEAAANTADLLAEPQSLVVVTIWETQRIDFRVAGHYEAELQRLMDDLGMRAQFVSLEDATRRSFSGRIVVLRMTEDTAVSRRTLSAVPDTALAWTHAPDGAITPFGMVDLGALRRFLRARSHSGFDHHDALRFGRALARVSAHEIFHMITRSQEHSPRGLMQASLTVDDLTGDSCAGWLPANRKLAQAAFPQALTRGVVAALREGETKR